MSGGVYLVSAVLASEEIMDVIQPGQHGFTFGGNSLAAAVAISALEVIRDEKLAENTFALGSVFRNELEKLCEKSIVASFVRGKGLMNALVINNEGYKNLAWDICMKLLENGLLAKPTHTNIIRFAPPLVINLKQLLECVEIISKTIKEFE